MRAIGETRVYAKTSNPGRAVFVSCPQARTASSENAFGYDGGASGQTIYTYVDGDPVNLVDPSGLASVYRGPGNSFSDRPPPGPCQQAVFLGGYIVRWGPCVWPEPPPPPGPTGCPPTSGDDPGSNGPGSSSGPGVDGSDPGAGGQPGAGSDGVSGGDSGSGPGKPPPKRKSQYDKDLESAQCSFKSLFLFGAKEYGVSKLEHFGVISEGFGKFLGALGIANLAYDQFRCYQIKE